MSNNKENRYTIASSLFVLALFTDKCYLSTKTKEKFKLFELK